MMMYPNNNQQGQMMQQGQIQQQQQNVHEQSQQPMVVQQTMVQPQQQQQQSQMPILSSPMPMPQQQPFYNSSGGIIPISEQVPVSLGGFYHFIEENGGGGGPGVNTMMNQPYSSTQQQHRQQQQQQQQQMQNQSHTNNIVDMTHRMVSVGNQQSNQLQQQQLPFQSLPPLQQQYQRQRSMIMPQNSTIDPPIGNIPINVEGFNRMRAGSTGSVIVPQSHQEWQQQQHQQRTVSSSMIVTHQEQQQQQQLHTNPQQSSVYNNNLHLQQQLTLQPQPNTGIQYLPMTGQSSQQLQTYRPQYGKEPQVNSVSIIQTSTPGITLMDGRTSADESIVVNNNFNSAMTSSSILSRTQSFDATTGHARDVRNTTTLITDRIGGEPVSLNSSIGRQLVVKQHQQNQSTRNQEENENQQLKELQTTIESLQAMIASYEKQQQEVSVARQKFELLEEKVEVEQELLKQDKRNFKRRFKAAKNAITKSQESVREAIVNDEEMKRKQLINQHQKNVIEIQNRNDKFHRKQQNEIEQLKEMVKSMEIESKNRQNDEEDRVRELIVQATNDKTINAALRRSSNSRSNSRSLSMVDGELDNVDPMEQQEQLKQQLIEQQMMIESYEMQLLELERTYKVNRSDMQHDMNNTEIVDDTNLPSSNDDGTGTSKSNSVSDPFGMTGKRNERLLRESQAKIDALQKKLERSERKYKEQVLINNETQQKLLSLQEEVETNLQETNLRERIDIIKNEYNKVVNEMTRIKEKHKQDIENKNKQIQTEIVVWRNTNDKLEQQLQDQRKQYQEAMTTMVQSSSSSPNKDHLQQKALALCDQSTSSSVGYDNNELTINTVNIDPTIHLYVFEYEWSSRTSSSNSSTDENSGNSGSNTGSNSGLMGMYTGWVDRETKNPDGNGTLRVDDGAIYDGDWYQGHFHGRGVYGTIDGDLYHGQWSMGKRYGYGVQVWSDGRVYRGPYLDDVRHGLDAIMTWPYGAYYVGAFSDDKRNGHGKYRYADGRFYVGEYQDERPHGYGVLRKATTSDTNKDESNILYDGIWQLGEFIGPETSDE